MLNKTRSVLIAISLIAIVAGFITGCAKEKEEIPDPLSCDKPNGTLNWSFDGKSYCANSGLSANLEDLLVLNGISAEGVSLSMLVDSVQPGTYQISLSKNGLTCTDRSGTVWMPSETVSGSITINSHSPSTRFIDASFVCTLQNAAGQTKELKSGRFRITYTQ